LTPHGRTRKKEEPEGRCARVGVLLPRKKSRPLTRTKVPEPAYAAKRLALGHAAIRPAS
jgi:hypothetical protein